MYQVLEAVVGSHRCCDLLLLEVKYALSETWRAQHLGERVAGLKGGKILLFLILLLVF